MNIARHNPSENQVLQATMNVLPDANVFEKNNRLGIAEIRNQICKGTNIFLDAENPNKTSKGNQRKTEIRIMCKGIDIFVEVKQQKTISNIQDSVLGEILRAKNIKGQFWLVLLGEPYKCPIVLKSIADTIKCFDVENKVKVMTNIEQYKRELQKAMY